jgi:two-component system, cell cycle sensor histidine kinase and response regulator CckA
MPLSSRHPLGAFDPSAAGSNWLLWLAAQAPSELLVLAALALVVILQVDLRRNGPLCRPRWPLAILCAAAAALTSAVLAAAILSGGSISATLKLAGAALLWWLILAVLWRGRRRRANDAALIEQLDRLRLLAGAVTASEDGVMIAEAGRGDNPRLRIVFANPAFERMTGYSTQEAIGLSPSVLADDAEPDSLVQIRAALRGTIPVRLEVPGRRKDGSHMWTEWQIVPVADANGHLTHSVAVLRDTTLRRGAEQALRDSEARFRGLFEQAADAILVLDAKGHIVDANRRACHCLGYTPAELTRLTLADLDAGSRFVDLGPGETFTAENWYRRKDGTEFPVEVRFAALEEGGRRLKLALVRDVTRRRSAEQALRESEELLRNIIAHIPCGVFWKDRNSIYLGCNDQVARDNGLEHSGQVVGKSDYEICYSDVDAKFYRDCDQEVMQSGVPIINLEEAQTRGEGAVTTLLTSKVPLRDSSGEVVGIVGVYQDITERKRLAEQLQQAQKMEAVGRLAGGIAHDFNNLLTIIRGNADLLRSRPAETRSIELIDDLRLAADRAAALVRQLLMFSRRQPARLETVDLNAVVSRLRGLLNRLLGERIVVETHLAAGPVTTRADNSHLEQVVMNLAVNARDAMPNGGLLTLSTQVRDKGDDGEPRTRTAVLIVSDTGVGMTEQVKCQIFEPFFTTKGPDKGTGLGLATVFGIVEQAGGRIGVMSAPGSGTTFEICLPWCEGTPAIPEVTPLPPAAPERSMPRGTSVLLVEDEEAVRKLARITLEGSGYSVTDAPDGEAALELMEQDRWFDALVTDMTMPGIDGRELAGRARSIRPDLGVVFVSGYVPDVAPLGDIRGAVFLPKPFTPSDLLRAVSRVVARPAIPPEALHAHAGPEALAIA